MTIDHTLVAKWTKAISITYNVNSGTGTITATTGTINSPDTNISLTITSSTPTRTGYTFKGWSTSSTATQSTYTSGGTIILNDSITLYAVWEGVTNTVTFDAGDGSSATASMIGIYGSPYGVLPDANYTGYIFLGWYTSVTGGSKVDASTILTSTIDHTLYAQYDVDPNAGGGGGGSLPVDGQYTITFNKNDGTNEIKTETVMLGTTITLNSQFEREGYIPLGWSVTSNGGVQYNNGDTIMPTLNLILYVVWEEMYEINYNINDGSNFIKTQYVEQGELAVIADEIFTRGSYNLIGWATTPNGDLKYVAGDNLSLSGDITLYAVWENENLLHQALKVGDYITYQSNSGTYVVSSSLSGYSYDQEFKPKNATLWRVFSINEDDGTIEIISVDGVNNLVLKGRNGYINCVQILQDISSKYANSPYALSARHLGYSEEGLSATQISNYKTIDTNTYAISYSINGDVFPYTDNQGAKDLAVINANSLLDSGKNVWLASRRTSGQTAYYIWFVVNATEDDEVLYESEKGISAVSNTETAGVRPIVTLRSGLYVKAGSGTASDPYTIIDEETVSESFTYTLSFDANGGNNAPNAQSLTTTSENATFIIQDSTPTRSGHIFKGWSTSRNSDTVDYTAGSTITINSNKTLYAVWGVENLITDKVNIGDYIVYVPNNTSYEAGGTIFDPSQTTLWRIFNNTNTGVEIMSTESVGDLEMYGKSSYRSLVQTLQNICVAYVNSNYAISGRSLGYSEAGLTEEQIEKYLSISSTSSVSEVFPYTDEQYVNDVSIINNNSLYLTSPVWLASRDICCGSMDGYTWTTYYARYLNNKGGVPTTTLYDTDTSSNGRAILGVCPVVKLKPNLVIKGGTGTKEDPYIIADDIYTVTATSDSNGTVTLSSNTVFVGGNVTATVTPNSGYEIEQILLNGANIYDEELLVNGTYTYELTNIIENHTIQATFSKSTKIWYNVKAGDYITYIPDSSSYTVSTSESNYSSEQIFNPSSTTLWQVFNIENEKVEIISAASVGNLALYSSTGYNKLVQTLQNLSSAYTKAGYSNNTRHLGYNEDGLTEAGLQIYKVATSLSTTDTRYTKDYEILNSNSNISVDTVTWLASRHYGGSRYTSSYGRTITTSKTLGTAELYYRYDGYTQTAGARPIVELSPEVYIVSGSGTESDPYVLGTNTTIHTITAQTVTNGTITPTSITVVEGDSASVTITPDADYCIDTIIADGEIVKTLGDVTCDIHDIAEVFTITGSGKILGDDFILTSADDSSASTTIKLSGTGYLSFNYSVSSESGCDKLTITVKDASGTSNVASSISGERSGSFSKSVSGNIEIYMYYSKDENNIVGNDRGTISNLKFSSKATQPRTYTFDNITSDHTISATFASAQLYCMCGECDNEVSNYGVCSSCSSYICAECGDCGVHSSVSYCYDCGGRRCRSCCTSYCSDCGYHSCECE